MPLHRDAAILGILHKGTQELQSRRVDTFDVGGVNDQRIGGLNRLLERLIQLVYHGDVERVVTRDHGGLGLCFFAGPFCRHDGIYAMRSAVSDERFLAVRCHYSVSLTHHILVWGLP